MVLLCGFGMGLHIEIAFIFLIGETWQAYLFQERAISTFRYLRTLSSRSHQRRFVVGRDIWRGVRGGSWCSGGFELVGRRFAQLLDRGFKTCKKCLARSAPLKVFFQFLAQRIVELLIEIVRK